MRENGWEGARYGSKHTTTVADDTHGDTRIWWTVVSMLLRQIGCG